MVEICSGARFDHFQERQASLPFGFTISNIRRPPSYLALGTHPKIVQELLGHSQISMTLDISSPVLPTLQARAMTHLNTFLAPQDLSLLSWLMSSKRKD